MSRVTSLHRLLRTDSWDSETIGNFLECDNSSINEQATLGRTPLLEVLRNSNCSIDIVKILLQYGADVNQGDKFKYTPLLTALQYCRDEAIVAALLEKGASIHVHDFMDRTPLRYTFSNCYKDDYMKSGKSEWKENVLNLLLAAGADLNKVDINGKSPLCHALWEGAEARDIELLMRKGGSLKACMKHASPLLCVTDGFSGALLRANVVELLLNEQASVHAVTENGFIPLQCALRYSRYESDAIRMLIDSSDVNAVSTWHPTKGNLLHFALRNCDCKPSIVNILLHRDVRFDELNIWGETPLHLAMRWDGRDPSVIGIALKHGASVNIKCQSGNTPLRLAVEKEMGIHVINLLLAFGAIIGASKNRSKICLLETALDRYCRFGNEKKLDVFKTLVKYYFLENPSFDIQSLILGRWDLEELKVFAEECHEELRRMESVNINPHCTLRKFVSEYFQKNIETDYEPGASVDFNQVLRTLAYNEFPIYFDVIASKIGKELLGVYAVEHCPVEFVINYECACELARFLSHGDLLRFIVAFYNANNHA